MREIIAPSATEHHGQRFIKTSLTTSAARLLRRGVLVCSPGTNRATARRRRELVISPLPSPLRRRCVHNWPVGPIGPCAAAIPDDNRNAHGLAAGVGPDSGHHGRRKSASAMMVPWRCVGVRLSKPGSHHAYSLAAPIWGAVWLRYPANACAAVAGLAFSMSAACPSQRQFTGAEKRRLF
jgi:hypothetical protein